MMQRACKYILSFVLSEYLFYAFRIYARRKAKKRREMRFIQIKQTTSTLSPRYLVGGIFVTTLIRWRLDLEKLAWLSESNDVCGIKDRLRQSISIRQVKECHRFGLGLQPVGDRERRHI
ncbi:hypothetical protein BDM02DRAFT_3110786 [Thelephora ganbajun]|uniref:Uncharacterized protein n=1 Tax=Thelephora ganbajun TaxID=370292 RepID=A0ACB6ZPV5_THEGA|nr:hypothetical protein BDM02DRAFT_3110786 [Thelephora ganbajun]